MADTDLSDDGEMEEIIVTAREHSSGGGGGGSGGGGGWGGGGWDSFVFTVWGTSEPGFQNPVYEVPIEPLPYAVEQTDEATVVRAYDYALDTVYIGVIFDDGSTFQTSRPVTDDDRACAPYLEHYGDGVLM